MSSPEQVKIRVYGDPALPTLIFLPGLHGDWTLVGSFRKALRGRVRFVEATYPRTLNWDLDDYAAGVEAALAEHGIYDGWLLGESFSSQVVWSLVGRANLAISGVILAGGFVRHPSRWGVCLAERLCGGISLSLLTRVLFGYAKYARFRFRHSPETLAAIEEFIARRTEADRQAAKHRIHLIAQNDPCSIAQRLELPLYALTGLFDPVVPWYWVCRWLKRNCLALREYRVIYRADHNVLSTAPAIAAEHVVRWVTATRSGPDPTWSRDAPKPHRP
jgi:pimeloyl-ACP methyl ester carboxylesterase